MVPKSFLDRLSGGIALLGLSLLPFAASAETLMMPDREGFRNEQVVVWGVTTQANGTAYTLDCGNGSVVNGNIADRSYINTACTYAGAGTYTAELTVGAESDTAELNIYNPAALTPLDLRGLEVNVAIDDGLRNLWITQANRAANFPASPTTNWGYQFSSAEASLIALAFQNQGYRLPANGAATGVYEKYIVQRALNWIIASQQQVELGDTPQGDDPCIGVPQDGDECTGLYDRRADVFHQSYTTGTASLALAGVGPSLSTRVVAAADVPGNLSTDYVVGKTYGEILQRMANALAWGQVDDAFCAGGDCGGWYYNFNGNSSDGSTIGWVLLALLDVESAGLEVPQWVKDEFGDVFGNLNTDGSLDYQADGNPGSDSSVGPAKVGVGLQGLYFIGEFAGPRVNAVRDNINAWWDGVNGPGGDAWACSAPGGARHKGCAYAMYNIFKGLRLQSIPTLPNVGRPAGPGAIPANDWYADYVDWLVDNQGATGTWGAAMGFSCCGGTSNMEDAVALLILSPVALVLPDPDIFSKIGLTHKSGSIEPETNLVGTPHTVTGTARAANNAGIPGTQIDFEVIAGPNTGVIGHGVTNASGQIDFTYTDTAGPGTDQIQASIGGQLFSNIIEKIWEEEAQEMVCDINGDGIVARNDIVSILGMIREPSDGSDLADLDGNGQISINDVRGCILRCTLPRCVMPEPVPQ